ncbi:MAG: ATP-binding protein [Thermoproteota archaeon]|nr:ATP-binding protein [Thermoproteota archaeon]
MRERHNQCHSQNNKKRPYYENFQANIITKDTGTGISEEIIQYLSTKSFLKAGLGLFIYKSIIEAHGGKIWAQNNEDSKGVVFLFIISISNVKPLQNSPRNRI